MKAAFGRERDGARHTHLTKYHSATRSYSKAGSKCGLHGIILESRAVLLSQSWSKPIRLHLASARQDRPLQ